MLVLIPASGFVGDLAVTQLSLPLPVTQSHAQASITIPRSSAAWSAASVAEEGGFLVQIATPHGPWRGVADRPVYHPDGLTLTVYGFTQWLALRPLPRDRFFTGATAAAIIRWAIRQTMLGLAHIPLTLGHLVEGAPLFNAYAISAGQSLLDLLNAVTEFANLEWQLEDVPGSSMRLHLVPRAGQYLDLTYVDTGRLFSEFQGTSLQDQYREIEEVQPSGQRLLVQANEVTPFWPARQIVQAGQ